LFDNSKESSFEPYDKTFKEVKGEKKQLPPQCFCQENKSNNNSKTLILRTCQLFADFRFFFAGALEPNSREEQGMSVCVSRHSLSLLEAIFNKK